MSNRFCNFAVTIASFAALAVPSSPAGAALVDVTAPGNLLALLPGADLNASSVATYGPNPSQMVDNFVNTATQDNGQVFGNNDPDQRIAVTGFDSSIGDLRFYLDPTDLSRFPSTLTIYYSTTSTTSLNAGNSAYTGANGGILEPTLVLLPGLLTPVPGDTHSGYLDLAVNAPAGTQTLLVDVGSANGVGDRISELQAFAVPEPDAAWLLAPAVLGAVLLSRRRSQVRPPLGRGPS